MMGEEAIDYIYRFDRNAAPKVGDVYAFRGRYLVVARHDHPNWDIHPIFVSNQVAHRPEGVTSECPSCGSDDPMNPKRVPQVPSGENPTLNPGVQFNCRDPWHKMEADHA